LKKELLILGILAILVFSGCTSKSTTQPTEQLEAPSDTTIKQTLSNDEKYPNLIKSLLASEKGLDITTQVADGRSNGGVKALILGYESSALTETQLADETGAILGSFIGAVKNGWDIDELMVVVADTQGNAVGTWHCSKEWINDYLAGKVTMDWLVLKAVGSMTIFGES